MNVLGEMTLEVAARWLRLLPLRLRKAAWMAQRPLWRPLLRSGLVPSLEHNDVLRDRSFATVVDIGANVGQFAVWADVELRPDTIICVEPQQGAVERLAEVASRTRATTHVIRAALGSVAGAGVLHVTRASDSSSLLAPTPGRRRGLEEVRTEPVRIVTGDEAMAPFMPLRQPVLLKIDVQGTELDVLRSLTRTLRVVDSLLVEVAMAPAYDGQVLFAEVIDYLVELGFQTTAAAPVPGTGGRLLEQVDLLCERKRMTGDRS